MRRVTLALVALAGAMLWPSLGTSAGAASRTCDVAGSRTVAAGTHVRVYRHRGRTWACHLKTKRRTALGDEAPSDAGTDVTVHRVRVAGHRVAFERALVREDNERFVVVLDARTGRRRTMLAEAQKGIVDRDARSRVTDLQLTAAGDVAWIVVGQWSDPGGNEVYRSSADGPVLLQAGPDVETGSLALAGRTIYWTRAGAPQRATF